MTVGLLVLSPGKWHGRLIPLTRSPFVIGRDPRCQLRPASPAIDERHCAIIWDHEKVYLRDLDSGAGTYLNGKPLSGQKQLKDDDHIKVGTLEFNLRILVRAEEEGTAVNKVLTDTVIETESLPPPSAEKAGHNRRRTTAEVAGKMLSQYLRPNR